MFGITFIAGVVVVTFSVYHFGSALFGNRDWRYALEKILWQLSGVIALYASILFLYLR